MTQLPQHDNIYMGMRRVTIYVTEEDYRKLRSKLALLGVSLSAWVRETIYKYINL